MNIGDQVGQYRVTQLLGEGGMGAVYKAVDTMIEREVAIKVLRPEIGRNANLLQRFRAEAVTLARLNHSGIATLYSFQQYGDEFLMIMEYVPGKTLEAIERERGALPVEVGIPLFTRILEAIGPAHESGILHRDIKPANIMVTTWGAIKVMDFGIARIAGAARQTRQGALVGTMEYIAPERVKGSEGDVRCDVYALGVVLFEMLTGRLPFNSPNEFELMKLHLEAQPPSFASLGIPVPAAIEAAVQRSLAKDPDARYANCEEFAEAVRTAAGDLKLSRGDMVALVGKPVVEQLGTAGHQSSISGETLGFAASAANNWTPPPQAAAPRAVAAPRGPAEAAPVTTSRSVFQQYKIPILAAAALVLAIGAGVGAGKLFHHGDAEPAETPPSASSTTGNSDSQANRNDSAPEPSSQPPVQPATSPSTQTIPPEPINALPVQETPVKPDRPAPKPHRNPSNLHDRALKALDE